MIMAVASGPAGAVLDRPVFTLTLKIAHAHTINNRLFWNSKIDIKYTFLGGYHPRNLLTNHCPEIESGGVWQLADYSKVPSFVCKTTAFLSSF